MAGYFAIPCMLLQLGRITIPGWAGLVAIFVSVIFLSSKLWHQYKLHTFYKRQNIDGPDFRPLVGNVLDIANLQRQFAKNKQQSAHPADVVVRSLPHLLHWSKLYGSVFKYMEGAKVSLCILDTNIIRELLVSKADCYRRSLASEFCWRVLGGSVLSRTDQDPATMSQSMTHCKPHSWPTLRRILGPGTDHDTRTVQGHLQNTVDQCNILMSRWRVLLDETCDLGDGRAEVNAAHDIAKTSIRIVLTNLIGSTLSHNNLRKIDSMLDIQRDGVQKTKATCGVFSVPRSHKDGWLNRLLTETVRFRFKTMEERDEQDPGDLLDLMICSYRREGNKNVAGLVEECKMMIAAQKSTTFLINQTLLLLARHTNWQLQARAEVLDNRPLTSAAALDEEGDGYMTYPKLSKLKICRLPHP